MDLLYPEIVTTNNIFIQLKDLRDKDRYTLQHSIAVAILCIKIGQIHKFPERTLKLLGMAGLLHDIGKARLPLKLLNKPGPLTLEEYTEIKKHPALGYQILTETNNQLDEAILIAVLQHHERINGQGYPMRLKAKQIHPFARIIAVADTFDALTTDRVYRPKRSPLTAAKEIKKASFGSLDPRIAHCFLAHFFALAVGETVRLNTGELAKIILINEQELTRPLIKTPQNQFIDLMKNRHLEIQEILI